MVAAISIRNMLQGIGLSLKAATEVTNINGQNLSILEDFLQLENKMLKPYDVSSDGPEVSMQTEPRIRGSRFRPETNLK